MSAKSETKFICGCTLSEKLEQGYQLRFSFGNPVCPEHGLREYGYLTTEAIENGILYDPRYAR